MYSLLFFFFFVGWLLGGCWEFFGWSLVGGIVWGGIGMAPLSIYISCAVYVVSVLFAAHCEGGLWFCAFGVSAVCGIVVVVLF